MARLDQRHVPSLLDAFALGTGGRLSEGPVARGRLGAIWRLETDEGTWAVKQIEDDPTPDEMTEIVEGAAFEEAAVAAGIAAPPIRRTLAGEVIAAVDDVRVRVHGWVDLEEPDLGLETGAIGGLVGRLHQVPFRGSVGTDPWYTEPVSEDRWVTIVHSLSERRAPFADELGALVPELGALARLATSEPGDLRTCHRDLWADNVRRTPGGGLCVFDFDNAGLADPSGELAAVLVEYAGTDGERGAAIQDAYAAAGGPGRVRSPADFTMPIAQLGHIVEEACRRWLAATSDEDRADNEAWAREFLDRPLTMAQIEALLSA